MDRRKHLKQIHHEIQEAIQKGNLSQVQTLVQTSNYNFADPKLPKDKNSDLLLSSLTSNHLEITKWLLKKGCPMRGEGVLYLRIAIFNSDNNLVHILLEHGARPDLLYSKEKENALHLACEVQNVEIVKLILASADPDIVNIHHRLGSTALHIAVRNNCFEIVQLIIQCKPNLEARTRERKYKDFTALHVAIKSEANQSIIQALIDAGADVNALVDVLNEYKKHTPLDLASARFFNYQTIKKLVMHNGRLHAQIDNRHYLLHMEIPDLTKNIVLLQSKNKNLVHPSVLQMIYYYRNFKEAQDSCLAEIEEMKRVKIIDGVSFYDFLIKQSNALAAYGRNQEFLDVFISQFNQYVFTYYHDELIYQFQYAQERASLLNESLFIFSKFLPYDVCEKIFDYLNLQDLENISLIKLPVDNRSSTNAKSLQKKIKFN